MANFKEVYVKLQSGLEVDICSWQIDNEAQTLVIVAPNTSAADWDDFVSFLPSSHSPILANVSSSLDLLMLIREIGEPVLVLAQGQPAVDIASGLIDTSPTAASGIIVCDGEIRPDQADAMHKIMTLILRGRQSKTLSHLTAVKMHELLKHSTLVEPENCGDFPAKDNPNAAASAIKMFLASAKTCFGDESEGDPIDPKPNR
jgi:pimeloyl-ACP methyl ester carboxylesterase